jgi:hypothetical protein
VRIWFRHPDALVCRCAIALDAAGGVVGLSDAEVSAGAVALAPPDPGLAPADRYDRGVLPAGDHVVQVRHPRYRVLQPVTIPARTSLHARRLTLVPV